MKIETISTVVVNGDSVEFVYYSDEDRLVICSKLSPCRIAEIVRDVSDQRAAENRVKIIGRVE